MKKKILILSHNALNRDPRPLRQIRHLKEKYEIHSVGSVASGEEEAFFEFKRTSFIIKVLKLVLLKLSLYKVYYWDKNKRDLVKLLKVNNYNLIIAHDEDTLPIAFRVKSSNTKVILDAHELFPYESTQLFFWRFFYKKYVNWLCMEYIPKVNAFFTVSESISKKYFELYNVKSLVISNACAYSDIEPSSLKNQIQLVHHGACQSDRKIELMIQMMDFLDDKYILNLILNNTQADKKYFHKIEKEAKSRRNVIISNPVEYSEIIPTLNKFDIGVYILPPTNLNTDFALPNKLFEFIQAKLAVAIGPSSEMARIVKQYDIGIVAEDFNPASLAIKIKELSSDKILFFKNRSKEISRELSSNNNMKLIDDVVRNLLN